MTDFAPFTHARVILAAAFTVAAVAGSSAVAGCTRIPAPVASHARGAGMATPGGSSGGAAAGFSSPSLAQSIARRVGTALAGYEHVFHQYTIRAEERDKLQHTLAEKKIGSAVYYPMPLHLQPVYASLGYKAGDFPHAEHAAQEVLSLPMYPELQATQLARVAEAVTEFVRH